MDTLRSMTAFVRSAELGSLSAAARALGTTQPTVSKMVSSLERSLGVRLFERSTTRVLPTEEGRRFLERARHVLEAYAEAATEARSGVEQPRGLLRVSAPAALGELKLNRMMLEFLALHPDIEVELLLEDRFVDPVEERIDVALRLGGSLPPGLVARRVATWPRHLVASPAYLERRGRPRRPEDLLEHDVLRYAAGAEDSLLLTGPQGTLAVPVRSRYRANSAVALLDAVLDGAGIALQPSWMVHERLKSKQLVRLLPQWAGPAQIAHLLHAPVARQPLRVRVLTQFLAGRIAAVPGSLRPD